MVVELGGAQREAGVGGGGRHVGVGRGRRRWREGGLERVVGVAGVDGGRGEEPVRVVVVVGGVGAEAQRHLVDYGAPLRVGQTVAMLEEWGRGRAGGQDGVGVVGGAERPAGGVGQQGVGGGLAVGGAAVGQVGEGVDSGRDEGVRTQRAVVPVPLFGAVVGDERLHLSKAQRMLLLPRRHLWLPGQVRAGREEGDGGGSVLLPDEAAAPFGPGPGL